MAYLNKVMLIGNIGKDPEIRMGQSNGRKCATFSLATSKRYRDNNGEQKELTTWHNIVAWGKTAETIEQLRLVKGTSLYVEGEITNRTWTDQSGAKRYVTEINISTFQLLTPRGGSAFGNTQPADYSHGYNPYAPKGGNAATQQQTMPDCADDDNGLPF